MDEKRRNIFAELVLQCRNLSECGKPKAAVIVGDSEQLVSIGYNVPVAENYFKYPVMMALQHMSGTPASIFLSYFPHVDELTLLISTRIRVIYFWGEVDDEESVQFLNQCCLKPETAFEMNKLKKVIPLL